MALTPCLPTAVCGGTSRPADPAPHRPGRHGGLCRAHDHRAGVAGEWPRSGRGVGGTAPGSFRSQSDYGGPRGTMAAPAWPVASRAQMGAALSLVLPPSPQPHSGSGLTFWPPRLSPSTHSPPVVPWLLPVWCFLATAPLAPEPKSLSPGIALPVLSLSASVALVHLQKSPRK